MMLPVQASDGAAPAVDAAAPFQWGLSIAPTRYQHFAEFFVSAVNWARTHVDEEGRPLGERVLPLATRQSVPFRMVQCPFEGGRAGRPMNVSAMTSVSRCWRATLNDLATLRAGVARVVPPEPSWFWLWLLGRVATAMSAAYLRRSNTAIVPLRLSTAFKPALGLFMTSERATLLVGRNPSQQVVPAEFARAAEETGALLSHDAACPGSPRLIEELAEVALGGTETGDWPGSLLGPLDVAVDYGLANAGLELARQTYVCQLILLTRELAARVGKKPPHISIKGRVSPTGIVRQAEELQRRAAATLGEALPAPVGLPLRVDALEQAADGFEAAWLEAFRRIQARLARIRPEQLEPSTIERHDLAEMTGFACHMVEPEARAVSPVYPRELLARSAAG